MKNNRKNIIIIIITIVIVLLITGGIYAYLTDRDQATNVFTQGSVKISITEPNWNQTNGEDIRPGNTINKDPQINNIGKNEAYVYIKVEQPIVDLMTGGSSPLFSYTTNSGWTLLKTEECLDPNSSTSIYYYNTALAKNTSTSKLFNNITVNNFDQNSTGIKDMVITGYAVQTRNLPSGTTVANAYNTYFGSSNNTTCTSKEIYRYATRNIAVGDNISSLTLGTDYVTNKSQVSSMNADASTYYLKHKVTNNVVTNSYVCFNVTAAMVSSNSYMTAGEYCVEGGVGNTAYTKNRNILTTAFGPSNCNDFTTTYNCAGPDLGVNANENGYALGLSFISGNYCDVHENGDSDCNGGHS